MIRNFILFIAIFFSLSAISSAQSVKQLNSKISELESIINNLEKRVTDLERYRPAKSLEKPIGNNSQYESSAMGNWKIKSNWRKLEIGLSKDMVTKLLGEAIVVSKGIYNETWRYTDNAGISGYVSFNEYSKVDGWAEP